MKWHPHKYKCTCVHGSKFTIAKGEHNQNAHQGLSVAVHTLQCHSATTRSAALTLAAAWMGRDAQRGQTKGNRRVTHLCGMSGTGTATEAEGGFEGVRGWGGGWR